MLAITIGEQRQGKTLYLTGVGIDSEREVYSNFPINILNYHKLEVEDLLDLPDGVDVLIDEMWAWLDARLSGSHLNLYLSSIIFQASKRDVNIYGSAQLFPSVDVRFRDQVNEITYCKRVNNGKKDKDLWDFLYTIYKIETIATDEGEIYRDVTDKVFWYLSYDEAKHYFQFYDSYNLIDPWIKKELERELAKERNPEKYFNEIKIMYDAVKPYFDDLPLTHDNVELMLAKKGFKPSYENLIYAGIKYPEIFELE